MSPSSSRQRSSVFIDAPETAERSHTAACLQDDESLALLIHTQSSVLADAQMNHKSGIETHQCRRVAC